MVTLQSWVIVLIVLWIASGALIDRVREGQTTVRHHPTEHGLSVSATYDGPFIVTHIAVTGPDWPAKRVAALPRPLACIDSAGVTIRDVQELEWLDMRGEPARPPTSADEIVPLYIPAR